jgi:hypothetical protein
VETRSEAERIADRLGDGGAGEAGGDNEGGEEKRAAALATRYRRMGWRDRTFAIVLFGAGVGHGKLLDCVAVRGMATRAI